MSNKESNSCKAKVKQSFCSQNGIQNFFFLIILHSCLIYICLVSVYSVQGSEIQGGLAINRKLVHLTQSLFMVQTLKLDYRQLHCPNYLQVLCVWIQIQSYSQSNCPKYQAIDIIGVLIVHNTFNTEGFGYKPELDQPVD